MDDAKPQGTYREAELASLGYEGEMLGVNLAVFDGGDHVADGSFCFTADEAGCMERAGALASDARALADAVRGRLGVELADGMAVEVSVERAQVGPGGIEDSDFEPAGFWHVEGGALLHGAP